MEWSQHRDIAAEDRDRLCRQLDRRPATWLRPFLVLAARDGGSGRRRPWYRLGPSEAHTAALTWRPHGPPELFDAFEGTLSLSELPRGCRLTLAGRWRGGERGRCDDALSTLLDLLAAALTEAATADEPQPEG